MPSQKILGERKGPELLSIFILLVKLSKDTLHCTLELRLGSGPMSEITFDVTEPSLESLELAASSLVAGMETTRDTSLTPLIRLFLKMQLVSFAQVLWTELNQTSPKSLSLAMFTTLSSSNATMIWTPSNVHATECDRR